MRRPANTTEGPADIATSGPNDGAVIRRTTTADGNVVTTFSPNGRQGPVIIGAAPTQDPRLAGQPNEDLIELTDAGELPTISASGLRPVDFYARPWSGARGTRIAIVIGGIGLSQTGSQKAVRDLPEDITLAFAATGNSFATLDAGGPSQGARDRPPGADGALRLPRQ